VQELSRLLYDGPGRERIHAPWRALVSGQDFVPRGGLSTADRTALAYERLRLANAAMENPAALAGDIHRMAALVEWAAVVDSSLGTLAAIHHNLFLGSLLDHDGAHRDLSRFISLDRVGTFLCTEAEHGNDAVALQTTATLDPATGGYVLHTPTPGAHKFMPNTSAAGGPKTALVAARLIVEGQDQGIRLFLTPLSDESGPLPGVTVHPLPERIGSPVDHCATSFDHVALPSTALLEVTPGPPDAGATTRGSTGNRRKRFLRSIKRVTEGKLCMSGAAVGVSRTALAIAVRYSYNRLISGPKAGERIPLAAHRSHHGRLLQAVAATYAMTFLHRAAVDRWAGHTQDDEAEAERLILVTKGWTTWRARDIVTECRERCGARGMFTVNRLAVMAADLEGTITAEGDNLVIWLKAASEMIFGHTVAPSTPRPQPCGEHQLTDPHFLRDLLLEAERIWQQRARAALRQGPRDNPVGRWNETSAPALEMVSVHARIEACDAFLHAIEQTDDPTARTLLDALCRLFLLKELTEHTGTLLAEGHLTADQVRAMPAVTARTLGELAPHLHTLVEAFDVPEEVLREIPLARGSAADDIGALPKEPTPRQLQSQDLAALFVHSQPPADARPLVHG